MQMTSSRSTALAAERCLPSGSIVDCYDCAMISSVE